jgi:PIN domain nuclease of toxin-antitoxin system
MKGLLDTQAFIWWDSQPQRLSASAMAFLRDPNNEVLVSVVSVWEILIKKQLGKLQLHLPLQQIVTQQKANGIQVLAVNLEHVLAVEALPNIHKDPFDRLLASQAAVEGTVLLTADAVFRQYPVNVVW